ncbi:hypothetical protein RB12269 [Rhodopirellula baltica SH 1]|uniref:Uncharacterized protein n=1 Tax=Rhodopirellula baltica (strain DSM 10527 / NCIMB 13988 / SH1) TaxID=243090 RepID=Q7UIX5_RHOBA|nr:hypothetical protein RB12269 [Rhodopirellula baltica SH 1]
MNANGGKKALDAPFERRAPSRLRGTHSAWCFRPIPKEI